MAKGKHIGFFEKYLTLWVALCIAAGIAIGHFGGQGIEVLSKMELYRVNIPVVADDLSNDVADRFRQYQEINEKTQRAGYNPYC